MRPSIMKDVEIVGESRRIIRRIEHNAAREMALLSAIPSQDG
jgi:hypothetical protein